MIYRFKVAVLLADFGESKILSEEMVMDSKTKFKNNMINYF